MFAYLSSPLVLKNEQIEGVVPVKQGSDFADVCSEIYPIVVSLLIDGTCILVQEPVFLSFLKSEVYKFYEDFDSEISLAF